MIDWERDNSTIPVTITLQNIKHLKPQYSLNQVTVFYCVEGSLDIYVADEKVTLYKDKYYVIGCSEVFYD